MIESAVTDLPEPDSPTSARVSPRLMSNETRSTARISRSPWRKATERSRTERRGSDIKRLVKQHFETPFGQIKDLDSELIL